MIVFQPYPPPKTLTSENTVLSWKGRRFYLSLHKASVCCLRVRLSIFTPSHFLHLRLSESAANWKIGRRLTSGPLHSTQAQG